MKKLRFLLNFSLVWALMPASSFGQLTGITPNSAGLGSTLTTTITSNGLFMQGISPNGNVYEAYLMQGSYVINIYDWATQWPWSWNVSVPDVNTFISDYFSIPVNAPLGSYDLKVTTADIYSPYVNSITHTLTGAFTVTPPDGYITGNVYKDLNRNGVKDANEPYYAGATVAAPPYPVNVYTNSQGNYSVPATNGNYKVFTPMNPNDLLFPATGADTIFVAVNNNNMPGNDFGVNGALLSISPTSLFKGTSTTHVVTASRPIFRPGSGPNGNVLYFTVVGNPIFSVNVASSITVIDSFNIQVVITTPLNAIDAPAVDLRLYTSTGYQGWHYLRQQLSVSDPPVCATPDSTWSQYVTASSFRVNWTPVTGAYRYQVYYKVGGTPTWTQRSVAGTKTFIGLQGLNCGTTYRWKVRTVCLTPAGNIKSVWTPVKVTNTLSCEAPNEDKLVQQETVAADIFPNPASEFIAIEAGSDISGAAKFELYHLTGALVMKKSLFLQSNGIVEVDVNEVPEGLYFIRLSGAVNHTTKIMIQH